MSILLTFRRFSAHVKIPSTVEKFFFWATKNLETSFSYFRREIWGIKWTEVSRKLCRKLFIQDLSEVQCLRASNSTFFLPRCHRSLMETHSMLARTSAQMHSIACFSFTEPPQPSLFSGIFLASTLLRFATQMK